MAITATSTRATDRRVLHFRSPMSYAAGTNLHIFHASRNPLQLSYPGSPLVRVTPERQLSSLELVAEHCAVSRLPSLVFAK